MAKTAHQASWSARSVSTEIETSSTTTSRSKGDFLDEQLLFSSDKLIGREQESEILQTAFNGLLDEGPVTDPHAPGHGNQPTRSLVLISGQSGSGKSALAMSLKQKCLDSHGFFISGKFDLHQMEEPFSGIKAAMIELCHQINALPRNDIEGANVSDPRRLLKLKQTLKTEMDPKELRLLHKMIPGIVEIVGIDGDVTASSHKQPSSFSSTSTTSISATAAAAARQIEDAGAGFKEQSEGLKFALQHFIQIISHFCPFVLVVDDIQWADRASLDLIQSWMSNINNSALMIVGCYRSNLLDDNKALKDTLTALQTSTSERGIRILNIDVKDLQLGHVIDLLREMVEDDHNENEAALQIQDSGPGDVDRSAEIQALAELVLQRTGGNPFFIQQYLRSLIQDGLISHDEKAMRWTWNIADIASKSPMSTTIIDLMQTKLKQVAAARRVLPIAACLGASFSTMMICKVIRSLLIHSSHSTFFKELFGGESGISACLSDSGIQEMLRSCESEGLIESQDQKKSSADKGAHEHALPANERNGPRPDRKPIKRKSRKRRNVELYSFVHDKVQEASLALVPEDKLSELQFRVGEVLLSCLSPDELDDKIFMVMGLLNLRPDLLPTHSNFARRMKIAMLNHQAGMKAVSCSAFYPALDYFQKAIELLPPDNWKCQLQKSLDIYSSAAECAYAIADMDRMQMYCNQIIESKECSLLQKLRAYHVLIEASTIASKDCKKVDAVGVCLSVLDQLGCKFPKSKIGRDFKTGRGLLNMKMACRKWDANTFTGLPVSTDPKEAMIMKTLDKLTFAVYCFAPSLLPMVVLEATKRTLAHGVTVYAPPAFAMLALIIGSFMNEFAAGAILGKAALEMANQMENQASLSRTMMMAYSCVMHHTALLEDVTEPLLRSYRIGMMNGDTESAGWSLFCHGQSHYTLGTPLIQVDADASHNSKILGDVHKDTLRSFTHMYWQAALNLRGASEHTIPLIGDVFNEREELQDPDNRENPLFVVTVSGNKMMLAAYFADYQVGAEITQNTFDKLLETVPGIPMLPIWIYLGGLCCYAASYAKGPARAKHLKMAHRCRKQIKAWETQGNPNCSHFCALLSAEKYALSNRHSLAVANYEKAIELERQRGCIHFQAVSCERFGDFLLRNGKMDEARHQYDESLRLHTEWGADRKVRLLRSRVNDLSWR